MIHSFSFNDESTVWIPPSIVGNSLSIFVWKRLLTTRVRNTGGLWRSKSIHTYLNNIEPNIWTKQCTVSWDIGVFKSGGSGWGCLPRLSCSDMPSNPWLSTFPIFDDSIGSQKIRGHHQPPRDRERTLKRWMALLRRFVSFSSPNIRSHRPNFVSFVKHLNN